jgi:RND family efflux transporter MFP subunit
MDIEQIVTANGTVQSLDTRSVSAAASSNSIVKSVNVKVGQKVKKGDTLCTFDTELLDINIASAKKSLSSANAQSSAGLSQATRRVSDAKEQYASDKKRLEADVKKAKKALDASKKKAKKATPAAGATSSDVPASLPSGEGIPGAGVTDAAQSGSTQSTTAQLQSAYDAAVAARDQTLKADDAAITNAKDALENQRLMDSAAQIQSQLDVYEQQKKDATIKSPISGTVTAVNAKEGSTPGMESALFIVENIDELKVEALVPEYDASVLTTGLGVDIISDAIQDESWAGEITSISPVAADASGNFAVTISVTTPIGGLKSGMSAKLNIVTDGRQGVFAVPYGALGENDAGESVIYVVDPPAANQDNGEGRAKTAIPREIVVKTGLETDYYVEISGEKLTEGLLVLTDPDGINKDAPVTLPDNFGPMAEDEEE